MKKILFLILGVIVVIVVAISIKNYNHWFGPKPLNLEETFIDECRQQAIRDNEFEPDPDIWGQPLFHRVDGVGVLSASYIKSYEDCMKEKGVREFRIVEIVEEENKTIRNYW